MFVQLFGIPVIKFCEIKIINIGLWLLRGLGIMLINGVGNLEKVKQLMELPKASTNLTLWKADMNEEGSFDEAIRGCHGVFHVATPMDFESKDPEVIMV